MHFQKKGILLAVGCVLFACFAASSQTAKNDVANSSVTVTEIKVDGLKAILGRQASHPLLVNFWATWCDPCRDEFPDLVKIDSQYRPKGLDFVSVSLDEISDINTAVPKFLREMNATMPTYLLNVSDPEIAINAVDPKWDGALPATFLYNQKGEIVYKHFGRVDPAALRNAIDKVLSTKL